ncbi:MAG TPA: hypothetical protein VFX61_15145 [Micromonosporaceae bacterium]|nr:hypothetical protein [Micromonosporaceae bacterium]
MAAVLMGNPAAGGDRGMVSGSSRQRTSSRQTTRIGLWMALAAAVLLIVIIVLAASQIGGGGY